MKFEGSGSKGTRVIERKRSVTDGPTDRRTDGQGKNNMSPPEGGRHNNNSNNDNSVVFKVQSTCKGGKILKMLCLYLLDQNCYILHLTNFKQCNQFP